MFYDKKCTVSSVSVVIEGNREVGQMTTIYDMIPCDFYPPGQRNNGYSPTKEAREYSNAKFEVVLQGQYDQIRQGMEIELFDLGSQGKFIVDSLVAYRLPNGKIDNITLQVNLRNVGSD